MSSRDTLDRFRFWQVGGIAGRDWSVILPALPFLLLGAAIVLATGRILNNLALGDDIARGLGQRVGLVRGVTALGIVLLCGSATALAGPIGFVGLIIPHAVRFLTGPDYRWILPSRWSSRRPCCWPPTWPAASSCSRAKSPPGS